jgi:threonine dehydrogenase-like Zn-dependent dehydrogenase
MRTHELEEFVREGQLNLSRLVSEILPLSEAVLALEKLKKKIASSTRIVLKP